MEIIRKQAFARAGLIGNPSDGYNGRTLALIVRNYSASVVLYEWEDLEIILSQEDRSRFSSIHELHRDVELHGYYGGARLVKATIRRFADYCLQKRIELHRQNFGIRYESTIPRNVGLAGSSAIIIATLRALMEFYQVEIPIQVQPSLALSVETRELGITAGLQDRVAQIYEGLVFMDFAQACSQTIDDMECGSYEQLDPALLPSLYVAFSQQAGEPTEVTHSPLRARYDSGDEKVCSAMFEFASITDRAKDALLARDHAEVARLVDANFDLRNAICDLAPSHVEMIETARAVGASAKFAGSGGAIVGTTPPGEYGFATLKSALNGIGCTVLSPQIGSV